MAIEYRQILPEDYERVRDLLSGLGWADRVADDERLRAMMRGADRAMVAVDGGEVVGFGRALCDGVSNGYISMVAVAESRRRQGIGRRIVEQLTAGDPDGRITWMLRAGRDSAAFWQRLGFARSSIAMERVRQR